jgi:hypothetical protein
MVRIAITEAAFAAIAETLPLGSVGYEPDFDAKGLAGEYVDQEPGAMDKSWSFVVPGLNTIGIDRVLFTTDYPYGSMKAARQFFDQMPINANDKEKIAHLNAERLLGLGQNERRPARRAAA